MTKNNPPKKASEESTGTPPALPPNEFSSLVTPFYIQALMALETEKDSKSQDSGPQLELAQRMIDLLDLLKTKTEGRLDPEETNILDSCLHQLKMVYLQKKETR